MPIRRRPTMINERHHPEILRAYAQAIARCTDPAILACNFFEWALRARFCCAPDCRETFVTAGRPFPRCGGCGVLRVCSRECQRKAWKHPTVPHKDICAKLRELSEKTGIPENHREWEALRRGAVKQRFIDTCKSDDNLLALAQDCAVYLAILSRMRAEVLDDPPLPDEVVEVINQNMQFVDIGPPSMLDALSERS